MERSEYPDEEFIFIDPNYLDCVLAAGDNTDLPALRDWCAALPADSYGRVFVQVESPSQIDNFPTPMNVGVTWLVRESRSFDLDTMPIGFESSANTHSLDYEDELVRAVDAWFDEWLRADPLSGRHFLMWTGARNRPAMREFWERIEVEAAEAWSTATERRLAL